MSAQYLGDYPADQAVYFIWSTNDGDGASITRSGDGVISVYKDNSDGSSYNEAQVTTDVTNDEDFDSLTGIHECVIATTDAWYETGHDYTVVLSAATVDTQTVNAILAHFSIENRTQLANVTKISGGATAADNLELQYDTTGLVGETFPATQLAVGALGSAGGGGAKNWAPTSDNSAGAIWQSVTKVGTTSDDFGDVGVGILASMSIDDAGDDIDWVFGWDVGDDQIVTGIYVNADVDGGPDNLDLELWNFTTSAWVPVFNIDDNVSQVVKLTNDFQGTGANLGRAYVRFDNNNATTPSNLEIFELLLETVVSPTGIVNGSTTTLGAATTNENFVGQNWALALGSQNISGSYFKGATSVTGISSGTTDVTFEDCLIGAATLPPGRYIHCGIGLADGTFTLASDGDYIFIDCYSIVPGSGSPDFACAGKGSATGINNRGWFGGAAYVLDEDITLSHEVVDGGGTSVTTAGADVEIRGRPRSIALTVTGGGGAVDSVIQIIANTGPITVTGGATTNSTTINVHGQATSYTSDATGTTENDYTAKNPDIASILTDTGTTLPASLATHDGKLDTVDGIVDDILTDTGTTLPATLATIAGYIDTEVAAILEDTGTTLPATLATIAGYLDTEIAAILEDTGTTIPGLIAALENISAAEVNAQVVDVMDTDTLTLPAQGAPTATPTRDYALALVYKLARNKITQSATTLSVYADDGTTVDHAATVSESSGTVTKGEMGTGA